MCASASLSRRSLVIDFAISESVEVHPALGNGLAAVATYHAFDKDHDVASIKLHNAAATQSKCRLLRELICPTFVPWTASQYGSKSVIDAVEGTQTSGCASTALHFGLHVHPPNITAAAYSIQNAAIFMAAVLAPYDDAPRHKLLSRHTRLYKDVTRDSRS
nr:hypothetical protein CFP56_16720 [Quercus suber]